MDIVFPVLAFFLFCLAVVVTVIRNATDLPTIFSFDLSSGMGSIQTRVFDSNWIDIIVTRKAVNARILERTLPVRMDLHDIRSFLFSLEGSNFTRSNTMKIDGAPGNAIQLVSLDDGAELYITSQVLDKKNITVILTPEDIEKFKQILATAIQQVAL